MKRIIRKIKSLFGIYESGYSYCVKLKDIVIPAEFQATRPRYRKMMFKREFFNRNGIFESSIVLDKEFTLKDGYTSYIIAKENGMKYVDVYFKC